MGITEKEELIRAAKAMTAEEQTEFVKGMSTEILCKELCERVSQYESFIQDVVEVVNNSPKTEK